MPITLHKHKTYWQWFCW